MYSEEEAPKAWEDFMVAEPAIYVAADGVYVATRYKRALCKGLSAPCKTAKDVQVGRISWENRPEPPVKSRFKPQWNRDSDSGPRNGGGRRLCAAGPAEGPPARGDAWGEWEGKAACRGEWGSLGTIVEGP